MTTRATGRARTAATKRTGNAAAAAPENAQAAADKNSQRKIQHVLVLMMENRSFDHIFGFRSGINGLTGKESNLLDPSQPESDSNPVFYANNGAPYAITAGLGPGHSINQTNLQLSDSKTGPTPDAPATNDGFVAAYKTEMVTADHVHSPTDAQLNVCLQSFAPARLPSINALADAFCVCDNWFSEVPGPTQPNRFYIHAATSNGRGLNNWSAKLNVRTIYDNLDDAGYTWATYSFDTNEVREFNSINQRTANFKQFQESFQTDVTKDTLADYSFIIPRMFSSKEKTHSTDGIANDQHAPTDARYGDNLIADVYEALASNPAVFAKSALIVTYDEHGGFYDHVIPASDNIPNPDGLNSPQKGDPSYAPQFSFDRLGLRVPAVIISPWVKAGRVDSTRYQHTSVLATLKKMLGLPKFLTKRDAIANTFDHLFDELDAPRTDMPRKLPRVALPTLPAPDDPKHPANQHLGPDRQAMMMGVHQLTKDSAPKGMTSADLPLTQGDAHDFIQQRMRKHFGKPGGPGRSKLKRPQPAGK
ncbi:MAG TPA: alkaline phosphatase family protein [Blastocatellia bacterium]